MVNKSQMDEHHIKWNTTIVQINIYEIRVKN